MTCYFVVCSGEYLFSRQYELPFLPVLGMTFRLTAGETFVEHLTPREIIWNEREEGCSGLEVDHIDIEFELSQQEMANYLHHFKNDKRWKSLGE